VASFIHQNFVPVEAHIKEHPAWFKRFGAIWTPTVLVLDSDGAERWRIEGYLPKNELRAQLEMALARIAATHKKWSDAEQRYAAVVDHYGETSVVPEALYWRDVARYNQSHDHVPLQSVARELRDRYPDSIWAQKASVWASE
jgi:hypothetical protein